MDREHRRRAWLVALGLHAWVLTVVGTLALAAALRPTVPSESAPDRPQRWPIALTLDDPPTRTAASTPAESPIAVAAELLPPVPAVSVTVSAPLGVGQTGLVHTTALVARETASVSSSATTSGPSAGMGASASAGVDPTVAGGGAFAGKHRPTAGRVVYLLDRSGSMGLERRLARAITALTIHAAQLPEACAVGVVAYNRQAVVFEVAAGTERLRALGQGLAFLAPEGGSDHAMGLRRALALAPDGVYWLTDASEPERLEAIRRAGVGQRCWLEHVDPAHW